MVKDINWYFTDEDYDVFTKERQTKNTQAERDDRETVRLKLLELNNKLLPRLASAGMDLHNHPSSLRNAKVITSLTFPCDFNKGHVNWLGVRYGKSEKHLNLLNYGLKPRRRKYGSFNSNTDGTEDKLGFQKYACMQVDVCYTGVDIGIYHAVPNDALDRYYLHDNIDLKASEIIAELKKLRFNGYEWNIYDPATDKSYTFNFDDNEPKDFIAWYKTNDDNGMYSSLLKHFPRNDDRISADNLEDTCFKIFNELYRLYQLLSWQPNKIEGVTD